MIGVMKKILMFTQSVWSCGGWVGKKFKDKWVDGRIVSQVGRVDGWMDERKDR